MSVGGGGAFRLLKSGAGRGFRVEIPSSSPLFEGHFPSHPILPGIAHLAFVEHVVGSLSAVRSLKLRRPVIPGDALDLTIEDPGEDGWLRFELRRAADTVSSGAVRASRREESAGEPPEALKTIQEGPSVEALLPHAPPARMIRGILAADEEEIVCAAEIPPRHPLAAAGRAPAYLGVEAAAQAAAVLEALNRRRADPEPRIGYLVGIREARFAVPFLPAGRPFRVAARLRGGAFPLSIYEIAVGEPGRETVTGSISTFLASS